jgi:2-polyprenyl-3-methyl-5-hydroxy-6-metoxy-1,4-benzoquinol methylase
MNSTTAERLAAINREFYERMGASFSATRQRLQPGVQKILETLHGDENILDLGCGNGLLARTLLRRGQRGNYLGIDSSPVMIREAQQQTKDPGVKFIQADLIQLASNDQGKKPLPGDDPIQGEWSMIVAFAVLHHIPGSEHRMKILTFIKERMAQGGQFIHSNWQFLHDEKLKARVQPWEKVGLAAADLEEGDTLLDWRDGGQGLRYVHQFSEGELMEMAHQTGFSILDVFRSDGREGKMGLYEIWKKAD